MEQKLLTFALKHTVIAGETVDKLNDLLSQLPEDQYARIVMALADLEDPAEVAKSIPRVSNVKRDPTTSLCYFEEFNYVQGDVRYVYVNRDIRAFRTQEDADKYKETGDYDYRNISNKVDEEHPFEAYRDRVCRGGCTLGAWKEYTKYMNHPYLDVNINDYL